MKKYNIQLLAVYILYADEQATRILMIFEEFGIKISLFVDLEAVDDLYVFKNLSGRAESVQQLKFGDQIIDCLRFDKLGDKSGMLIFGNMLNTAPVIQVYYDSMLAVVELALLAILPNDRETNILHLNGLKDKEGNPIVMSVI